MRPKLGILLALILALTLPVYGDCPNCHKNQIPMAGHGAAVDGSGRRNVNVQIDSSFNDSPGNTNANIWNGVRDAALDWNNATTTGTPTGQATNYHFNLNQSAASGDVDVRVVMGSVGAGNLAVATATNNGDGTVGPPYTVTLPPDAKNWSADFLRSVIAHELGHTIGLSHAFKKFQRCQHTIMNHTAPGGRITGSVQPQDVAAANKQYNNRHNCTHNYGQQAATESCCVSDPEPSPFYWPRTCYYYWTAVDYYNEGRYMGSVYYLDMVICF